MGVTIIDLINFIKHNYIYKQDNTNYPLKEYDIKYILFNSSKFKSIFKIFYLTRMGVK